MHLVKKMMRAGLSTLAVVAVSLPLALPASGQDTTPFVIDHQYSYKLEPGIPGGIPILLKDQFSTTQNDVVVMERFSTPVDKNGEGILFPEWHYTWWRLGGELESPFPSVIVRNQFGEQSLDVGNAAYLLAPTLKNVGPIPDRRETSVDGTATAAVPDHYKCYDVIGDPLTRDVVLSDQFGTRTTPVLEPRYLCNPVEKIHDGIQYPISNPEDHLVCYQVLIWSAGFLIAVEIEDQFGRNRLNLDAADLLCVPSRKEIPTQVSERSWGSVKSIYR